MSPLPLCANMKAEAEYFIPIHMHWIATPERWSVDIYNTMKIVLPKFKRNLAQKFRKEADWLAQHCMAVSGE